jgi:hypothetical protein
MTAPVNTFTGHTQPGHIPRFVAQATTRAANGPGWTKSACTSAGAVAVTVVIAMPLPIT